MPISDELRKRLGEALSKTSPATPDSVLTQYLSEITVRRGSLGYANPRVTADIDALSTAEVTHVKLIPVPDEGYVILLSAKADEEGAIEFNRFDSRRTGEFNMRMALLSFQLDPATDRKLKIPVSPDSVLTETGERKVLLLRIKRPSTAIVHRRPRKKNTEVTTSTAAAPTASAPSKTTTAPTATATISTTSPSTSTASTTAVTAPTATTATPAAPGAGPTATNQS